MGLGSQDDIRESIRSAVEDARSANPLVGSITNTVTVNFVANAQLAVGGSAAMVYLPDEGEQLSGMASAFYINLGTLFPVYAESVPRTAAALAKAGKPWVLDPVGIGIGSLRAQLIDDLKPHKPTIVRGNASEVIALARAWDLLDADAEDRGTSDQGAEAEGGPRGVDATDSVSSAEAAAVAIARYTGGAVCVSGEVDLVTDGAVVARVEGGSHLMEKITGAGCSLGGVCAVYAAVADPFTAALTATAIYDAAGKTAEEVLEAPEPASFQVELLDELFHIPAAEVARCPMTFADAA